jgi:hypothetical protein
MNLKHAMGPFEIDLKSSPLITSIESPLFLLDKGKWFC